MFESLFTPTERPRIVRQGKAHLGARVNGNLALRFTGQGLTSFAGLELVRQFLQRLEFSQRLRRHLQSGDPAGDFSSVAVVRLILANSNVRYAPSERCLIEANCPCRWLRRRRRSMLSG